uniref:L-Fucosyltransferase n=1 Tax=Panagrolaimus sp. JU765 TaxID=591449 RepID=A0AC34R7Q1_9BILA
MTSENNRVIVGILAFFSLIFVLYNTCSWNFGKDDYIREVVNEVNVDAVPFDKSKCPVQVCPSPINVAQRLVPSAVMPTVNNPPMIIQTCPVNTKSLIEAAYERKYIGCNFWATGGIGNQIWRFASIYGLARYTGREPFFEGKNAGQMEQLMEIGLVFPMMSEVLQIKSPPEVYLKKYHFADDCCKFDDPRKLIGLPDKYIKVAGDYMQSYKFFHEFRDEIRTIFQCGMTVKNQIDEFANQLFKGDKSHKLCAHVRRGDFIGDLMLESKEDFTVPAIHYAFNFLKNKTGNQEISMLFIGNDHDFINKLPIKNIGFKNIYTPEAKSRGEDMCMGINYCDSMLMTASGSTFGWWISYLMKPNSTIFYNSQITDNADFTKDVHDFDIFPPDWLMLTVEKGLARRETRWWHQRRNQPPDLPPQGMQPWV